MEGAVIDSGLVRMLFSRETNTSSGFKKVTSFLIKRWIILFNTTKEESTLITFQTMAGMNLLLCLFKS